jgi:hypothetical protein
LAVSKLMSKLDAYKRPFDGLESEYKQRKYLDKEGFYISPHSYTIGSTSSTTIDLSTDFLNPSTIDCTGQFISTADMINALHAKKQSQIIARKVLIVLCIHILMANIGVNIQLMQSVSLHCVRIT